MLVYLVILGLILLLVFFYKHRRFVPAPYPNTASKSTFSQHLINYAAGFVGCTIYRIGSDFVMYALSTYFETGLFLVILNLVVLFSSVGLGYLSVDSLTFNCPTHGGKSFFFAYIGLSAISTLFYYSSFLDALCIAAIDLFFFLWDRRKHSAPSSQSDPQALLEYIWQAASESAHDLADDDDGDPDLFLPLFFNLLALYALHVSILIRNPRLVSRFEPMMIDCFHESGSGPRFYADFLGFYNHFIDIYNSAPSPAPSADQSWPALCCRDISKAMEQIGFVPAFDLFTQFSAFAIDFVEAYPNN